MASTKVAAVEDAILKLCRDSSEGMTDKMLSAKLPTISLETLAQAINALLSKHRLQVLQDASSKDYVYKEMKAEDALKFKGLGTEDMLVYQHIQQAGNMGIWTRDLRAKTNLQQPAINKILKTLDSRALVKSVKSVANANRKVYMLFDLEPARELTGGAWYTDHDFDKEFIEVLQRACHQFILQEGVASLEDVAKFVRDKGFSRVALRPEDVLCILRTLEYDGLVESRPGDDGDTFVPASLPPSDGGAFAAMPCGTCPVIGECKDGGIISPATCIYFDQWLQF